MDSAIERVKAAILDPMSVSGDGTFHCRVRRDDLVFLLGLIPGGTSKDAVVCGWCGETVTGPCNHPDDPCGLYGDPDEPREPV